ncbi:TPA: hypothetical protein NV937_000484 [Escherichia coli]|nr:hypothetical protein [Escherichia coli]
MMEIDEIKNHFEIALSCKFDGSYVPDPEEIIRISTSFSEEYNVLIEKTYDSTELAFYNKNSRTTTFILLYNTTSDLIEIITCKTIKDVHYETISNVSYCSTEEGYFQESLVKNLTVSYSDLSTIINCVEKLNDFVLSMFDITEQNPKVIKC